MKKKNLFLKSTSSLIAMLFVVMSAFMFTACDDDPEPTPDEEPVPENSILEIIEGSDDHTQLASYLELYPDLLDVISDTTNSLTVFAPNNAAFTTLEATLNTDLERVSPAVIGAVLAFHVHTGGAVLREDITGSTELSTVQGEDITFNGEGNVTTGGSISNVPYDGDEILANNGVVHSVGNILIPPVQVFAVVAEHLGKVSQAILLGADFTTLAAAINKADAFATGAGQPTLKSILSDESASLTVFAPVNQVFTAADITLDDLSGQEWYGLIANHVLTETVLAADLSGTYTSAAGSPITVLPSGGLDSDGQAGAEATIAAPDAFVSQINGVVHAIAGILRFPPPVSNYTVSGLEMDNIVVVDYGAGNYDFYLYSGSAIDLAAEDFADGTNYLYMWTESGASTWTGGEFTFYSTSPTGKFLEEIEFVLDYNTADEILYGSIVDESSDIEGSVELSYNGTSATIAPSFSGSGFTFSGTVTANADFIDATRPEGKRIIENLKSLGLPVRN